MKSIKTLFLIVTIITVIFSCGDDSKSNTNTTASDRTTTNSTDSEEPQKVAPEKVIETDDSKPFQEKDMIYAWVDKLNIRDKASLKGKAIAAVDSDDELEFTGTKSGELETIVLRAVAYEDVWYKIITNDKKEGWVFGGAVKHKNEKKGNDAITDTKFAFPHFGEFDLSKWKKLGTRTEGEEVDYEITSYQKGNQILEIINSDMGEFHYGYDYKLMDGNKKILKTRVFSFSVDAELRELTETVKDFTTKKEYTRTQKLKTHFYQLNARPKMVNGTWSEKALEVVTTSPTTTTAAPVKGRLQPFEFADCSKHVEKEFDCSCSFSTGDPYKGPTIFASNWGKNACVKVDGQLNALYPDWEKRDYKGELKKLAQSKNWIEVKNSGILYFGKKLAEYKYENAIEFLTDVILASGKDITSIPIKNTADGMAIREVRDETTDAIAKAKEYKSKGGNDPLVILKMDNRSYDVIVRYRQITQYEGEANKYEGSITILKNRGKEILETKVINGNCGC